MQPTLLGQAIRGHLLSDTDIKSTCSTLHTLAPGAAAAANVAAATLGQQYHPIRTSQ
jgi:hypothetical protein